MYYSTQQLAALALDGFPRTREGWRDYLSRNVWPSRTVPGRGGRAGTRTEYQPPPEVQRLIDERIARVNEAPSLGEVGKKPGSVALTDGPLEQNLLVEITVKLERAFLSSPVCARRLSAFIRDHRDAVTEFAISLRESRTEEDVRIEALLKAVSNAWINHAALHALVAADIYNKAIVTIEPTRRARLIDKEVAEFIRVREVMLSPSGRPDPGAPDEPE